MCLSKLHRPTTSNTLGCRLLFGIRDHFEIRMATESDTKTVSNGSNYFGFRDNFDIWFS